MSRISDKNYARGKLFPGPDPQSGILDGQAVVIVATERLILRRWRRSDRAPFARLNADPRVMEFMPGLLSPEESDGLVDRIEAHFRERGFGLCAVELRQDHSFIGFIGLAVPSFQAKFTPCVEVGWRLAADYWGRGLATEGAREMVRYAFEVIGLDNLVSFTVPAHMRSRRVMEKLGMTHDPADDFDHPKLPEGHPLRRHVLYRLRRSEWDLRWRAPVGILQLSRAKKKGRLQSVQSEPS